MIYAIDFDGTIVENAFPEIGKLLQEKSCRDWHVHAHRIEGAAKCLQTWIDGIREETKETSCRE